MEWLLELRVCGPPRCAAGHHCSQTSLEPTLLNIILLRAGMQRGFKTIDNHVFGLEIGQGPGATT